MRYSDRLYREKMSVAPTRKTAPPGVEQHPVRVRPPEREKLSPEPRTPPKKPAVVTEKPVRKVTLPRADLFRGAANLFAFFVLTGIVVLVAVTGLATPAVHELSDIAVEKDMTQLVWAAYGVVIGIGATLVFSSLLSLGQPLRARFVRSLQYGLYFAFLFIFANVWF
jgi:hypothetical protein